jgi:hypothetical protein
MRGRFAIDPDSHQDATVGSVPRILKASRERTATPSRAPRFATTSHPDGTRLFSLGTLWPARFPTRGLCFPCDW